VTLFQATLPVPQQIIPSNPEAQHVVATGQHLFEAIGCAGCHVPALALDREGWIFTEPNPFNPPGNLQADDAQAVRIDLTDPRLPGKRPKPRKGVVWVSAFTDLKLHDISDPLDEGAAESININHPPGSEGFLAGNRRFLTKKLWGSANESPYFHHGRFTTLREATRAHAGEAEDARAAFDALLPEEQAYVIAFIQSLRIADTTRPMNSIVRVVGR
jgi:CxxC motif-containing protein (DUF1111 family)